AWRTRTRTSNRHTAGSAGCARSTSARRREAPPQGRMSRSGGQWLTCAGPPFRGAQRAPRGTDTSLPARGSLIDARPGVVLRVRVHSRYQVRLRPLRTRRELAVHRLLTPLRIRHAAVDRLLELVVAQHRPGVHDPVLPTVHGDQQQVDVPDALVD